MRRFVLLCGVCLLGLAGCKRADPTGPDYFSHLAAADEFVVYSLDPRNIMTFPEEGDDREEREGFFHRYPIVGEVKDVPVADRRRLLAALHQGMDNPPEGHMRCFIPHHGIRASFGSSRTDLLICFDCLRIVVYGPDGMHGYPIRSAPRAVFNEFLQGRGVKIQQPDSGSGAKSQ